MQKQDIIYQQSLQFLPKISLKLEHLFSALNASQNDDHPQLHHHALKNLLEIIKIIEKPELKSRYTKEFLKLEYLIPKCHYEIPKSLWANFQKKSIELQQQAGRFSHKIHQDAFLHALRSRTHDIHHESDAQPPHLVWWLHQNANDRKDILEYWIKNLEDIRQSFELYLKLLRHLAEFQELTITQSYNHQSIPSIGNCQLILLKMDPKICIIPKLQIGTHGVSMHFTDAFSMSDLHQMKPFNVQLGIVKF